MRILRFGIRIFFLLSFICALPTIAKEFNVMDFGSVGDGEHLETQHIQNAINKANETGGIVVFPAGTYLSGTIYLKSNVSLRLDKGATLLGSTNLGHYPENMPAYAFFRKGDILRALIFAEQKENISILGEGTIDGQGFAFEVPANKSVSSYSVRPYVIWMIQCKKVRVEGIKLQNSALWMQHYLACENLRIHNIEVYNHSNKNNDMMDIDGCKDVIISDCRGDTDDDGITLKSTHARPNENITITNCILSSHCNAIKCGTESVAGFKNITISNCVIRPSLDKEVIYGKPGGISGISLEVVDGAKMNGVHISNIVMDGPEVPLFIRLGNRARGYDKNLPKPEIGSIQNITISNVTAFNAKRYGSSITGIPDHPVRNVTMDNVRFYYEGGGSTADGAKGVDEKEKSYPEATMFGVLPAYGLYVRHVENISMRNIALYFESDDQRSPLVLDDVINAKFEDIQADIEVSSSFINAKNSKDIFIENPLPLSKCAGVIHVTGKESNCIILSGIQKNKFNELYTISDEVDEKEVRVGNLFE